VAIQRNGLSVNGTFSNTGSATTINPTLLMTALKPGDRVVAFLASIATNPTITGVPAGWTQVGTLYKPTTTLASAVFYRDILVDDDTDATQTWTWSAAGRMTSALVGYSGSDLTIAPTAAGPNTGSGTSFSSTAQTVADGDWLLTLVTARQSPGDAGATEFTAANPADFEVFDMRASATGTTPQLVTSYADTNGALPAGSTNRTINIDKTMAEAHVWSIRLRAPLSTAGWRVGAPIR
jgi:hypothetical protein